MKMNLVNYEYVKLDRCLIFYGIVTATDDKNDDKVDFFQKIIRTIMDYERANKTLINEFYIKISDIETQEHLKDIEITVERQMILNAILYAAYNMDIEMLQKLTATPIQKHQLSQDELGDNLDYILNHSINLNEYINGEKERIVYDVKENKLEKAYIFKHQENKSYQRLRLK